jgi:hypothetical protein
MLLDAEDRGRHAIVRTVSALVRVFTQRILFRAFFVSS